MILISCCGSFLIGNLLCCISQSALCSLVSADMFILLEFPHQLHIYSLTGRAIMTFATSQFDRNVG